MRLLAMAGLAALLAAAPAQAQDALARFGWFGFLSGACWIGEYPDGKTRHKQCFRSQYGSQFIRGTVELSTLREGGAFQVALESDSVYSWNAAAKRVDYTLWSSDGTQRVLQAAYEGEDLVFPVPSRTDPAKVASRSVWRRINLNTLEVRRQRPAGNGWENELVLTYIRDPKR